MNLIPLQSAFINQQRDIDDNTWHVYSEEKKELGTLPNTLSPKDAMSYLHFARPFELQALNIGIKFGRQEQMKASSAQILQLKMDVDLLIRQNDKLSTKLEKFIIGKGE